MKKKKKFAKICKKERLSNRQSDRSRESLFLRYTDGAINSERQYLGPVPVSYLWYSR